MWAVYSVSAGAPLAAFIGVFVGHFVTRRGASELDRRAKREETMRTLRWAGELAVAEDRGSVRLGIAALDALGASPWLQAEDQAFIEAILAALVDPDAQAYREVGEVDVVEVDGEDEAAARSLRAEGSAKPWEGNQ